MGKTSDSSSRSPAASASAGRIQRASTHSLPSQAASAPSGARRHEEPGVEADLDHLGGDPARERHERLARRARGRPPPGPRARAVCAWPPSLVVHRAAGEDPGAAHEALLGVALHEQHLGPVRRVAQDDQRCGLAGLADLALGSAPRRAAGGRSAPGQGSAPYVSRASMEAGTKQLYMCTSCGFIYDPDEGDPDGGIPPGTAFERHPGRLVLPGLRRAQEGLRALRGLDASRRSGPSRCLRS